MVLTAVVQRVTAVAEIEVSSVIDLDGTRPQDLPAAQLHRRLGRALGSLTLSRTDLRGRRSVLQAVRSKLLTDISMQTISVLKQALRAFKTGMSADVEYVVRQGREQFSIDASQMPFIRSHDAAISAAIKLRRLTPEQQWNALEFARKLNDLRHAGWGDGDQPGEESARNLAKVEEEVKRAEAKLPKPAGQNVRTFVAAMEPGSTDPDALPVALGIDASSMDLLSCATVYEKFGRELRRFDAHSLRGKPAQRLQAQNAWTTYAGMGQCYKVAAAWLRALAIEDDGRLCTICYRHVAALSRCRVHATSTYETREARLGKAIRPIYLRRTAQLARQDVVRSSLYGLLRPFWEGQEEMRKAAIAMGVPEELLTRALVLGGQLRRLYFVFHPDNYGQVEALFKELVDVAVWATSSAKYEIGNEARCEQTVADSARELLSLKGFFIFWFGKRWIKPFGSAIRQLGFDPNHPAVHGALDPGLLPTHLLRQRGWEDSYVSLVRELMPDKDEIDKLLAEGWTFAEIAARHGVTHQTIRNSRDGQRQDRRRNRLPKLAPQ